MGDKRGTRVRQRGNKRRRRRARQAMRINKNEPWSKLERHNESETGREGKRQTE